MKREAMKAGISTALFAGKRLEETHFEFIEKAGFESVEILAGKPHFDITDKTQIRKVRKNLDKYNLRFHSLHTAPDLFFGKCQDHVMERMKEELDALAALGGGIYIVHPSELVGPENPARNKQGDPSFNLSFVRDIRTGGKVFRAITERLRMLAIYAKEKGSKIALENMGQWSDEVVTETVGLLYEVCSDNMGICFDAGHANQSHNTERMIRCFEKRIITTHLHDNHGEETDEHLLPFFGSIDWRKMLETLKENEYNGVFVYEPLTRGSPISVEQTKRSLLAMRSLWEEVQKNRKENPRHLP